MATNILEKNASIKERYILLHISALTKGRIYEHVSFCIMLRWIMTICVLAGLWSGFSVIHFKKDPASTHSDNSNHFDRSDLASRDSSLISDTAPVCVGKSRFVPTCTVLGVVGPDGYQKNAVTIKCNHYQGIYFRGEQDVWVTFATHAYIYEAASSLATISAPRSEGANGLCLRKLYAIEAIAICIANAAMFIQDFIIVLAFRELFLMLMVLLAFVLFYAVHAIDGCIDIANVMIRLAIVVLVFTYVARKFLLKLIVGLTFACVAIQAAVSTCPKNSPKITAMLPPGQLNQDTLLRQ